MIGQIVNWDAGKQGMLSGKVTGGEKGKRWRIESKGKTYYVEKDKVKKGVLKKKKKMKIAVLISGRLTNYDTNYQSLMDNVVQDNDVDFYAGISTEPINEKLLDGFLKLYKIPKNRYKISDKPLLDITNEQWNDPKVVKLSPSPNDEKRRVVKNPMFMWRNRDAVMDVFKRSNVTYDWVISTRIDMVYKNKLNYSELDPNKLNIPHFDEVGKKKRTGDFGGYQDKIAIGKKPLILKYLDVYDHMKKYLIDDYQTAEPEKLTKNFVDKFHKLPVKRVYLHHTIFPKIPQKQKIKAGETGQK